MDLDSRPSDGAPAARPVGEARRPVPVWAWAVAQVLRLWAWTLRVERPEGRPVQALLGTGGVLACWHGELVPLMLAHRDLGIVVVVSRSRDGARLGAILEALGYQCLRGSTSRGARAVGLAALRTLRAGGSVAIAVDGPRGPRRVAADGAQRLAALGRRPLLGVRAEGRGLQLPTWDGAWLPWPWSTVRIQARTPRDGQSLGEVLGPD